MDIDLAGIADRDVVIAMHGIGVTLVFSLLFSWRHSYTLVLLALE